MRSADPLKFEDTKKYTDRVSSTIKKLELYDAIKIGTGKIDGREVLLSVVWIFNLLAVVNGFCCW